MEKKNSPEVFDNPTRFYGILPGSVDIYIYIYIYKYVHTLGFAAIAATVVVLVDVVVVAAADTGRFLVILWNRVTF